LVAGVALAAFLCASAGPASASIQFDLQWGSVGTGNSQFTLPTRAATDSSGNVYVSDTGNHRIQKFNSSGTFVSKLGATVPVVGTPVAGTGDGEFTSPQGVATDSSANIYVADTGNNRVQKLNSSGVPITFVTKWGSLGAGNGQFNAPQGIATDSSGNVYVADTGNNRIQKFSSSGTFLLTWGSAGTGNGQFTAPSGVATDSFGNVYVADSGNNRIQKFSSSGAFIAKWGSAGAGNGQFGAGTTLDVATGSSGNVIVADPGNNRIQKFRPSGTFITTWGSLGTGTSQFNGPSGVAVASTDHVYVVDRANNRIQKFHETDATAPNTQIDSGPSGLVNSASPSFAFSSEVGASFECRLDSNQEADFQPCSSPKSYSSLGEGAHTFEVRAVDAAGNPDQSPSSRNFTVDTVAPNTQINSGPSSFTNDPTPTFTFQATEAGSSLECKVDSAPYAACNSPKTTPHLADGSHTFAVRATDPVGNLDSTPASRAFKVRTAAVHVQGSTLIVTAAAGAKDNFVITSPSASVVRVTDMPGGAYSGSGVHAYGQCTRTGDSTANCNAAAITEIEVSSTVLTDKVTNSTPIPSSLVGGAANDVLVGGSGDDTLSGGLGADVIKGMDGNDQLLARDRTSDTINCDGGTTAGTADKSELDLLPKDSPATGCETVHRY